MLASFGLGLGVGVLAPLNVNFCLEVALKEQIMIYDYAASSERGETS